MINNILFIWIPKTAGTSLYLTFKNYGCLKLKRKETFLNFKNKGFVTFAHVSIKDLLKENIVLNCFYNSSFKFCFVRNPYDRSVSLYHHFKRRKKILKNVTFKDYCKFIYKTKIDNIGLYNVKNFSQSNSQIKWIPEKIDFIGRYENLEKDFDYICNKMGIKKQIVPWKNKSKRESYINYYNNETLELVYNTYKDDFQNFDYKQEQYNGL